MPNLTIKILKTYKLLVKIPYICHYNLKSLNAPGNWFGSIFSLEYFKLSLKFDASPKLLTLMDDLSRQLLIEFFTKFFIIQQNEDKLSPYNPIK